MGDVLLVTTTDPLNPARPDPHFAADAAVFDDVVLVDHDQLCAGDGVRIVNRWRHTGIGVYRGWMLSASRYAQMHAELAGRDIDLLSSPAQFQIAHELPGWYGTFAELTPETVWTTDGPDRSSLADASAAFGAGPAILRDFTKSAKHAWDTACYIADVADLAAVDATAAAFADIRGDAFTGGYVLRRFETWDPVETRTWWVNGTCRRVGPHPDRPDQQLAIDPGELDPISGAVNRLGCPFVTVDVARRADGALRVVEVGDGGVSNRPSTADAGEFYNDLFDLRRELR